MLRRFPREELRRRGLNDELIQYFDSLHRQTDALVDAMDLNFEVLMGLQTAEIATQAITGTTGSEQTLITAGADALTVLQRLVFTNHHSGAETVSAYLVPSGGSVANATKVLDDLSLAAGEAVVPEALQKRVLDPGTTLRLAAGAADRINVGGALTVRQRPGS